jgi:hypothetical protein
LKILINQNNSIRIIISILIVFILFTIASIVRSPVDIDYPLHLVITPDQGNGERVEPILTYGHPGEADFVFIKYEGTKAKIGYAAWGTEPIYSKEFAWYIGSKLDVTLDLPSIIPFRSLNKIDAVYLIKLNDNSIDYQPAVAKGHIVIKLEDKIILNEQAYWHLMRKEEVEFGCNSIGGIFCTSKLLGKVAINGQIINRLSDIRHNLRTHYNFWCKNLFPKLLVILIISIIFGLLIDIYIKLELYKFSTYYKIYKKHSTLFISTSISVVLFTWLVTHGNWNILQGENFGDFYDYQALSFLQGRLDVPLGCLNGEAFFYNGHVYGYMGPTPSFIRMPLVLLDIQFGKFSRISLLISFIIILLVSYLILIRLSSIFSSKFTIIPKWCVWIFILSIGIGSPLYFLGSRAYIYHEAIIWGIAFSLLSVYYVLLSVSNNMLKNITLAIIFAWISHFARPSIGLWSFSLIAFVVLFRFTNIKFNKSKLINISVNRIITIMIIYLSIAAAFSSLNLYSYIKFKDFTVLPLKYHVQYTPDRLSRFGSKLFNINNMRYNFTTYFINNKLYIKNKFPFIYYKQPNIRDDLMGAKMDVVEFTAPLYNSMFTIFILSIVGIFSLLINNKYIFLIYSIILSIFPILIIIVSATSVSNRYSADFLPVMILLSGLGIVLISKFNIYYIKYLFILTTILVLISSIDTAATFQRVYIWGVSQKEKYEYYKIMNYLNQ